MDTCGKLKAGLRREGWERGRRSNLARLFRPGRREAVQQYNHTEAIQRFNNTETVEQLHAIPQHGSQPNGSSSIRSLSTRFQLLLSSFHWQEQGSSSGVVVEKCQHSFNRCSSHYCCVNIISAPSMDSSSRSSGWLKNIISDTAPATDFNQYCYNH